MSGLLTLFPGQGSQAPGMAEHLWNFSVARDTFAEAQKILGWDVGGLCRQGSMEELTRTDRTQLTILACSVATWRVLEEHGLSFDVAVGHSLGEYSALVATGHMSFVDALEVVDVRGRGMQACAEKRGGAMSAIIGLETEVLEEICTSLSDVWLANYNSPGQLVISGAVESVRQAGDLAQAKGAKRVLPLPVSGAFHTPFMAGAAESLSEALARVKFKAGPRRFFSTTESRFPKPEELAEVLARQLMSPVRFAQSVEQLLVGADAPARGLEVGPGGVLTGLSKRIARDFPVASTGDAALLTQALGAIAWTGGTSMTDSKSLNGRVALVTGGARGIGRAIALRLAADGAKVGIVDLADNGAETAREVEETAGRATTFFKADISKEAEAQAAVAAVESALGPVDILVNNAGITRDGLMLVMSEADWDAVLSVNLKGAFLMSKAVMRGMIKRRSGSIVNISSVVGRRGNAGQGNYSAAKAGLIGLTKSLAKEVASRNVRVNAVAPGYIETDMTAALDESARNAIISQIPLGRIGMPEGVADAVAFLAGDSASFITGAVLPVDGGLGI